MEELKDGAVEEQIEVEDSKAVEAKSLTADDVQKLIADAVGETNKQWQSRFDKVLSEKKQTETKALTVEERLAQMEADRQRERIEWARKEARARASIDDDLHNAMLSYASGDVESVGNAADSIKAYLDTKYGAKIADLEKRLQFGSKPPTAGARTDKPTMTLDQFNELSTAERLKFHKDGGILEG